MMIEKSDSIFCAITHGLYEPWIDILHSGQTPTWLSNNDLEGFEIHHFHGVPGNSLIIKYDKCHEKLRWTNRWVAMPLRKFDQILGFPLRNHIPKQTISRRLKLTHPVIEINFIDIYSTMKWKDLAILEYFYKHSSSNYLFMTTTSSYVRPAKLIEKLTELAHQHADIAMMSRTHGQPASPTTLGKEIANVVARLSKAKEKISQVHIPPVHLQGRSVVNLQVTHLVT
jgi:hypothetical protein